MGITIEQYRGGIGADMSFLRQREVTERLAGTFWNTMLMLFYLNVFYFPTLKQINGKCSRTNETVVWFIKMVCYQQVYVHGLLRLSNDVETNPGPTVYDIVDPVKTVCADFSQGHVRFGQLESNVLLFP